MLGASGIAGVAGAVSFLQPEMIATTANSAITDRSFFIRRGGWVNHWCITRLFHQCSLIPQAHSSRSPRFTDSCSILSCSSFSTHSKNQLLLAKKLSPNRLELVGLFRLTKKRAFFSNVHCQPDDHDENYQLNHPNDQKPVLGAALRNSLHDLDVFGRTHEQTK